MSDILENGILLKEKSFIFLRFSDKNVRYDNGKHPSGNFDLLKENSFFLPKGGGVNIYLAPPLNPLNYAATTEITFSPDQITENAGNQLKEIGGLLAKLSTGSVEQPTPDPGEARFELGKGGNVKDKKTVKDKKAGKGGKDKEAVKDEVTPQISPCEGELNKFINSFSALIKKMEDGKQKEMRAVFDDLKKDNFQDKGVVKELINTSGKKLTEIENYLNGISAEIEEQKKSLESYKKCNAGSKTGGQGFINAYVITQIIDKAKELNNLYISQLKNTKNCFALVSKAYNAAEGEGKNWYSFLARVDMEDDKIASLGVSVKEEGYTSSAENPNQIEKTAPKQYATAQLKFRKFQRFIPEISAGFAYTDLRFPKFGVTTDKNTGKQYVSEAGEDRFKKMNFTTMINLVYYARHTSVHPFWQVGVGANVGYPTFFTGLGGRINMGKISRLAISVGFAGTWIKNLDKLSVNSEVSGTAELEKDLKFEFSFPLKPYLGVQYNF